MFLISYWFPENKLRKGEFFGRMLSESPPARKAGRIRQKEGLAELWQRSLISADPTKMALRSCLRLRPGDWASVFPVSHLSATGQPLRWDRILGMMIPWSPGPCPAGKAPASHWWLTFWTVNGTVWGQDLKEALGGRQEHHFPLQRMWTHAEVEPTLCRKF